MQYIILFLEGVITFISPCLLPMLPVYVCYFAGNGSEGKGSRAIVNAAGFVLGFTLIFVIMGAFAGSAGRLLREYNIFLNIVTGAIVIIFGLNFMGLFRISIFRGSSSMEMNTEKLGFFSSVLFGMVFSIGWTPCVGAFLGSALMLAGQQGEMLKGILMLLCFSAGLGIPFMISAILIEKLKSVFDIIKRHYKVINYFSGTFLILIGILMVTGYMGYFLSLLTF
jgi:cytochrome c-type biogenesis protein